MLFSIKEGLKSFTLNPIQTLFSILGIVIGVASLVSILALGDGLESYSRKQLSQTTAIQKLSVVSQNKVNQNGLIFRNNRAPVFTLDDKIDLVRSLDEETAVQFYFNHAFQLNSNSDAVQLGSYLTAFEEFSTIKSPLLSGKKPDSTKSIADNGVWITQKLQKMLSNTTMLKDKIKIGSQVYDIKGIIADTTFPRIYQHAAFVSDSLLRIDPPTLIVEVAKLEEVNRVKNTILKWKEQRFGATHTFVEIQSYEGRLAQAEKAATVFKIIMGLITGISVLVGGIGVMNVLLMSVKERTPEIGIRKAVGAKKIHLGIQFLSESISITLVGSALGFLLSFTFLSLIVPILKHTQQIDFPIEWSLNTLFIVTLVAFIIGIFFGTYPALKAARLNPIDAIQRV